MRRSKKFLILPSGIFLDRYTLMPINTAMSSKNANGFSKSAIRKDSFSVKGTI